MGGHSTTIQYALDSLADEINSRDTYLALAGRYSSRRFAQRLREIAEMEDKHARYWREFLERRGVDTSDVRPSKFRIRLFTLLSRVLGIGLTLKLLEAGERGAVELYSKMLEMPDIGSDEKREIRKILEDELIHEHELVEEETRLKEFMEHVRDAVLGMSDGLVEVLSVSAGLAGAYGDPFSVAVGGLIVGIAGALSMGIGVFASVRAQRQVRLGVLSRIRLASKYVAHIFRERLERYIREKGISDSTAKAIADEASKKPELLGRMIAEEEYGLKEEALENPVQAGVYTGIFYIVGALLPLSPYILSLPVHIALPASFIIAALMLAGTGFVIAVSADLDIKGKMLELVVAGLGSATITYIIGRAASALLGVEV